MRNTLRNSLLLRVLFGVLSGVLILLTYAPQSSAIAGVRRRAVRRTAIVVGSAEKSAAEKQKAAAQQQRRPRSSRKPLRQPQRSRQQQRHRLLPLGSSGYSGRGSRNEDTTAETPGLGRSVQRRAHQRGRLQRCEGEDTRPDSAVKLDGRPDQSGSRRPCSKQHRT